MKIPDPNNPGQALDLTEEEYRRLCAAQHAKDKKRPDGRNKSEDYTGRETIELMRRDR